MTRPYAEVIGDPIAQSKSPAIHNHWLRKAGIGGAYRTCHVRAEGLAEYLAERRRLVDAQREMTEVLTERAVAFIDLQAATASPVETKEESR